MKKLVKIISILCMLVFVTLNLKAVPCNNDWPCPPPAEPNNGWEQLPVVSVAIDGCPNCIISVTFSQRVLCTGARQLQMESFTVSNGCRMCFSDGVLFQKAIGIMLENNTIAVPTVGEYITGIEVVNVSCWKWTGGNVAPWVMSWCNTDNCCTVEYTISRDGDGNLVIVYYSDPSNYVACPPDNGVPCLYVCDWLPDVGMLAKSINIDSPNETVAVQDQNNSYTTPNPGDNTITIGIKDKINGKLDFDIFNSTGERIVSSEMNCKMNEPKLALDVSNFINGVYFYHIMQDGKIIGKGKFVIKH